MGSSAASAAATAIGINKLFKLNLDSNALVEFAGIGERASAGSVHYDNVAASVLGGFVIVRTNPLNVIKIEPPKRSGFLCSYTQNNGACKKNKGLKKCHSFKNQNF